MGGKNEVPDPNRPPNLQSVGSKTEGFAYKKEVLLATLCNQPLRIPSKDKLGDSELSEEWDIVRSPEGLPLGTDSRFLLSELGKLKNQGKIEHWVYLA